MRDLGYVVLAALLAVLVVTSVWLRVAGPCSAFKYTSVQHVPARCLGVK